MSFLPEAGEKVFPDFIMDLVTVNDAGI
jgi:hypothetical protein